MAYGAGALGPGAAWAASKRSTGCRGTDFVRLGLGCRLDGFGLMIRRGCRGKDLCGCRCSRLGDVAQSTKSLENCVTEPKATEMAHFLSTFDYPIFATTKATAITTKSSASISSYCFSFSTRGKNK